jgi:DNA-binding MarR family transcriptional regulator
MAMPDVAADDPLADLADLILNVGRLVRSRIPDRVPLTDTERQIMRVVDLYPGAAPSEIARRTRLQRTNVSTALRSLEDKGMISRAATTGRGIAVTPTERAATNLRNLRAAWSRELAGVLGDDLDAVRHCNQLLSHLEQRLIEGDADQQARRLELAPLVGGEAVFFGDRVPEGGEAPLAGGGPGLGDVRSPQVGVGPAAVAAVAGDVVLRPPGEIGVHLG